MDDHAGADPKLLAQLAAALDRSEDLEGLVRAFKSDGGRQEVAYATLEKLRELEEDDSPRDDRLTDLMDLVSGWCSPDDWIWVDVEYPVLIPTAPCAGHPIHPRNNEIIAWCRAQGVGVCRSRFGYRFRSERDAERFVATWAAQLRSD